MGKLKSASEIPQHDLTNTSTSAGAPNGDLQVLSLKPRATDLSAIDEETSQLAKNKEPIQTAHSHKQKRIILFFYFTTSVRNS